MSLSSNELFHFTKKQYLKAILKDKGFYPRYNAEFVYFTKESQQQAALWAIPMVCFCDIPFELSINHRKRYGNVAIVMTEDWKLRKKLNPVIYLQSESHLAKSISNLTGLDESLFNISKENQSNELIVETVNSVSFNLNHLSYFLKQFENKKDKEVDYNNSINRFEKRRFYDEREWRFIPFEFEIIGRRYIHMGMDDYNDPNKLNKANDLLREYKLSFDYSDVQYVVVESELDRIEINNLISDLTDTHVEIRLSNL